MADSISETSNAAKSPRPSTVDSECTENSISSQTPSSGPEICKFDPSFVFDIPEREALKIKPLKALINTIIAFGLVGALIAGYAAGLRLFDLGLTSIGLYGTILVVEYLIQLCCALANRFDVNRIADRGVQKLADAETNSDCEKGTKGSASLMNPDGEVSVAVVGYREDEQAWRDCLRSLRTQNLKPKCIIGVVDGNDEPDLHMANAFVSEFESHGAPLIHLPILLSELHRDTYFKNILEDGRGFVVKIWDWLTGRPRPGHADALTSAKQAVMEQVLEWNKQWNISSLDAVCFSQPHGHKRTAMYTAFAMSLYALQTRDAVFTTDSDTLVQDNALDEMLTLLHSSGGIGGVTAEVKIWNRGESLLARLCSTRYWFAFNVERACQSLWNCVSCLSGPMSMYRACDLDTILGPWNLQTFGGKATTFGDDRHLTNQLLAHGLKTRYTHRTWCDSESPTTFVRWITQQTRWSKSFFREAFWFPFSFAYHSPWMLVETTIQAVYPLLLIATVIHILFGSSDDSHWHILIWLFTMFGIAFFKSLVAAVLARDLWLLLFSLYGFVYFFGLLPTKIWAFLTMNHVAWGTSARSGAERKRGQSFLQRSFLIGHLVVWYTLVLAGLGFFLYKISGNHLYFLIGGAAILLSILLYWQRPLFLGRIQERVGGMFKSREHTPKDLGVVHVYEDVLPQKPPPVLDPAAKPAVSSTTVNLDHTCDSVSIGSTLTLGTDGDEKGSTETLPSVPKAYIAP